MSDWLEKISPFPSRCPSGFAGKSLCGHMSAKAGWVEARRQIYDHELILIENGRFEIEIEDISYTCDEHSYLIVPPGRWHTTRCLKSGKRHYVHFDWEHWPLREESPVMSIYPTSPKLRFIRPTPKSLPTTIMNGSIISPAQIYTHMERLELMMGSEHGYEQLAARGVLLEILIRLLAPRSIPLRSGVHQEELAYRARNTLDRMVFASRDENSVCEQLSGMGYSYEHLARVFRKQYGVSPIGYLHNILIERAKILLRHSNRTIAAIAEELGYRDAVYFSRLFKRHTGTTPARFRGNQDESCSQVT